MAEDCYKVFVYGTLKKGQPNEYVMTKISNVKYLGLAVTCAQYPLIIAGEWNLPMLLDIEGEGKRVEGELYQVNGTALKQLDEFEGHPDFYKRKEIQVKFVTESNAGSCVKCWTYFIKDYTEDDLKQECFSQYDSEGGHGLAYDIRENEDHPNTS